jgi:hypothetical protein
MSEDTRVWFAVEIEEHWDPPPKGKSVFAAAMDVLSAFGGGSPDLPTQVSGTGRWRVVVRESSGEEVLAASDWTSDYSAAEWRHADWTKRLANLTETEVRAGALRQGEP